MKGRIVPSLDDKVAIDMENRLSGIEQRMHVNGAMDYHYNNPSRARVQI